MIRIGIEVEQAGAQMAIKYHAETNETSTPAEEEATDKVIKAITQYIAANGGSGRFVQKPMEPPEAPDFPDRQPNDEH